MTLPVQLYILALATGYPFPCVSRLSAYFAVEADRNIIDTEARRVRIQRLSVTPVMIQR